jgi:anti-anti-sigma factor
MPVSRSLRHNVHALLRRGERGIVLDLSAVSRIDAAGIGELMRTFNMAAASEGALRIVNATRRVREMLERAGVFHLLSAPSNVGAPGRA